MGCIVRDHRGEVLLSAWRVLRNCATTEEAEAMACLEGVQLVREWIRKPTIIESDCACLIASLLAPTADRGRCTYIYQEIKACMILLPKVRIKKVRRECNRVAHELAQLAKRTEHCAVWRVSAPDCIRELLLNDCNYVP
ncbi:hypothetical protein BAE44_0001927 [Dichanthelium oligosanthes]|uniref:RNase H type-1 domain-containing protein n=1 Tax=Dichanthelium oligosanthes TaxID=888268 RepID=A0A1E5WI22_9POAL|nr:hypothetical protein BAE44_0001927 [Dichanthelium oligosanthes]